MFKDRWIPVIAEVEITFVILNGILLQIWVSRKNKCKFNNIILHFGGMDSE